MKQLWQIYNENYVNVKGKPVKVGTPKQLWAKACKYFKYIDENPFEEQNWVGKDGREVVKRIRRPYTLAGLQVFLGVGEHYFNELKEAKTYDYSDVIALIEKVLFSQKFEGAAAGLFKENIIARDLGLIDKTENNLKNNGDSFTVTMNIDGKVNGSNE